MTEQQDTSSTAKSVKTCGGKELKKLIQAGLIWLDQHHQEVNALNVFPVPDGDTGTNMLLTMRSACQEITEEETDHAGRIAQRVAHGALMGARGNSGVILSQIWRGFSRKIESLPVFDVNDLAAALREASDTAYKGVVKPVEGTILTVVRQAAEAAEIAAQSTDDLIEAISQIVHRCHQAVIETPRLLKVLADAGVVDAGGQGFAYIMEGMLRYLNGEALEAAQPCAIRELDLDAVGTAMEAVEPGQDWEVVIDFRPRAQFDLQTFYDQLETIGTSIQFGEGESFSRMHIHLAKEKRYEPIEYVETQGTVVNIHMENLIDQIEQQQLAAGGSLVNSDRVSIPIDVPKILPGQIATIAVAPGEGIARVFKSLGVAHVVSGGQTMNPSTEQIVEAIQSLDTDKIIVLPNNKNIIMTAESACQLSEKQARTVRTKTIPQGVSALLALDPDGDIDQVVEAMSSAAFDVISGEITVATRDVVLDNIDVHTDNIIGLVDGTIASAGSDITTVVRETLEHMEINDRELLTLYYGEDTKAESAGELAELIREWHSHLDVEVIYGGQPFYFYFLSAE